MYKMTKEEQHRWNQEIERWPHLAEEYVAIRRNKVTGLYDFRSNFKSMWITFYNSLGHHV